MRDKQAVECFKALADPIRWEILRRVATAGECGAAELEQVLPIAKSTISYHTKLLGHAGLIEIHRSGRTTSYRLGIGVVGELRALLGALMAADVPKEQARRLPHGTVPTW